MIQVVVSYLDGRFSCFFVEEPVESYADLLSKIKEAVPYILNVPDSKIRVAYKDNKLGVFIAIAPYNNFVLQEAFRNAYDCGAENFRRLELEIREIDSPFVAAKSRRGKVNESETSTTTKAMRNASSVKYSEEPALQLRDVTSHKQLNFDNELDSESENELVTGKSDWKNTKLQTMNFEYQELHDELVALDAQIDELSRPIVEPPPQGTYKTIVCGNCHLRGHRAEGNKNNAACTKPACLSYVSCGQRKKHAEHFDEIKNLKKRHKALKEELDTVDKNKKNLAAFESKTISAFSVAVTGRLLKAFPDRYDTKTATGKIKLQKDIATIRMASNNKVPPVSLDDRVMFMEMLEKQQQKFDQIDHIDNTKGQSKDVFTTNYVNNCSNNSTNANCPSINTSSTVNISPVSTKKSKKKKTFILAFIQF